MMTPTPSPIGVARIVGGMTFHVCIPCTAAERRTAWTSDPVSHVQECHPESAATVQAQFAPRHHKIVRTAR